MLITLLPGAHDPRVARITCWEHGPETFGAYQFELGRWFDDGPDLRDRSRRWTMREQLLTKRLGGEAVDLVEEALDERRAA